MPGSNNHDEERDATPPPKGPPAEAQARKILKHALEQLMEVDGDFKTGCSEATRGGADPATVEATIPVKAGKQLRCALVVHSADAPTKPARAAPPEPARRPDTPPRAGAAGLVLPWLAAAGALAVALVALLREQPKADPPPDLRGDLAKLGDRVDAGQASFAKLTGDFKAPPPAAVVKVPDTLAADIAAKVVVPKLTDEEKKAMAESIAKAVGESLPKVAPAVPAAPAAPPTDVFVLITHGAALDAGDYAPALREAVLKRDRGKDQPTRVGLAVGQTSNLVVRVGLEEATAKLDGIGKAAPDDSEEPGLLGGKLKKEFKPERGRQRAILVVSAGCAPMLPKTPGWSEMTDVHVVVVARKELGPADRDRLSKWLEYAEGTRGTVTLIGGAGDLDRQNKTLGECLRRLIRLAD